jgi:hypothetical protein
MPMLQDHLETQYQISALMIAATCLARFPSFRVGLPQLNSKGIDHSHRTPFTRLFRRAAFPCSFLPNCCIQFLPPRFFSRRPA